MSLSLDASSTEGPQPKPKTAVLVARPRLCVPLPVISAPVCSAGSQVVFSDIEVGMFSSKYNGITQNTNNNTNYNNNKQWQ